MDTEVTFYVSLSIQPRTQRSQPPSAMVVCASDSFIKKLQASNAAPIAGST